MCKVTKRMKPKPRIKLGESYITRDGVEAHVFFYDKHWGGPDKYLVYLQVAPDEEYISRNIVRVAKNGLFFDEDNPTLVDLIHEI